MIRIAISQAAFDAIAATLPLGSVGYENKTDAQGQQLIWLDQAVVDRLRSLRGPGESYGDVILRLGGGGRVHAIAWPAVAQSRPIFYSLPQRRCYAWRGVDRPASRHAGLHSASTSLPCSMEVQPCPCHLRPVIRLRH